jgi:hypothetical protein
MPTRQAWQLLAVHAEVYTDALTQIYDVYENALTQIYDVYADVLMQIYDNLSAADL